MRRGTGKLISANLFASASYSLVCTYSSHVVRVEKLMMDKMTEAVDTPCSLPEASRLLTIPTDDVS